MIVSDLNQIELIDFQAQNTPGQRCRATFPLLGAHGSVDLATVYFELAPGDELGMHTDSAEELLHIIEGEAEVTVGDETGILSGGQLALVPKLAPHNLRNTGNTTVKVLGFFGGANNIESVFEDVWLPIGSNVVNTSGNN